MSKTPSAFQQVLGNVLMIVAVGCAVAVTWSVLQRNRMAPVPGMSHREIDREEWNRLSAVGHRLGSQDAAVVIVEFTDLECPVCKRFHSEYWPILKTRYSRDLALVVRHFPLSGHDYAYKAARGLECAARHDKFERVFELVGSDASLPSDSVMNEIFAREGIDSFPEFQGCWNDESPVENIEADREQAVRLGLASTPTLIVNGTLLRGLPRLEALDSIIQTKLQLLR